MKFLASLEPGRLLRLLQVYEVEDPADADVLRARQIEAVVRMTPMILVANWISSATIAWAFLDTQALPLPLLVGWLLLVCLLSLNGLPLWLNWRAGKLRKTMSTRAMRRLVMHAGFTGLLWAFVPQVLLPHAQGDAAIVCWVVVVCILAAGSFALGAAPWAGTAFIAVLAIGTLTSATNHLPLALHGVVLLYMLLGLAAVWSTARTLGERLTNEAHAERQSQWVGLLLRDFEEHSTDLLWETNAAGLLISAPDRIATALKVNVDEVTALPLMELLQRRAGSPHDLERQQRMQALRTALQRCTPFRDLTLTLGHGTRTAWVSISAKPKFDAQGHFAGWRGVATDETRAQQANAQLRFLAHHDPVTGLPNRAHFRELARQALTQEEGGANRRCAVVCLDLDHFKNTNDTLGHAAGDALLMEVARRLAACTRRGDLISRLGGDEFAMLFVGVTGNEGVEQLADRLMDTLQKPMLFQGLPVPVRVSMGLAVTPGDGREIDALMNHADLALHEAKAAGRATWRRFAAQIAQHTRRRNQIEEALRDALRSNQLWLAYQPKADLASGRIVGFEALLRWNHPELGSVSPAEFIPVAEASGLIVPIGAWVLDEALRAASHWPASLSVAVNVSPSQAVSPDFARTVRHALDARNFEPYRLELEITESIFINEGDAATAVLRELRALGTRIALDDFGTGYSSLAYLRNFPFDTLKIDRSFMRELLTRDDARAIVDTILRLAHQLKMTTVAEGIEELPQIGALREHGCQVGQGYLIAKPMPEVEVDAFLAGWANSPAGRALLPAQQGLTLVA
ncbi:MAG: bifunctional diguanylate cyclase/phosphodiesterase [Proteobacteria bacterium]|nr:bifunctional diguanylate cyclase/phosphodiesterase [Pseudomonadota bacterium]